MSETIPGGRQRSSSDGDILDECFSGSFVNSRSSNNLKDASTKKIPGRLFSKHHNKTDSSTLPRVLSKHAECDEDLFDSDGGISSQGSYDSSKPKKRNRKLSFKSVRKAVSRAFVKEGKTTVDQNATNINNNHVTIPFDSSKIWTPELRHLGRGTAIMNETDSPRSILSSTRPLITDPELGMSVPKWKRTPGTIGIFNHSNSCFMNAVLQCLSNTDSFTEYFVQEFYKRDLKQNKTGKKSTFRSSHGEVTEQLAHLLNSLWCGKYSSDISKAFKGVIAKVNNQYHGDDQHDAQEFLLWLLDRIHEDVYSVSSKKKIKHQKSSSLKSDEELAQEALAVNGESFIFKLFQALHSSTLTCPACGDSSRKFDPYLCVSLPLPQRSPRLMYVSVVYLEHNDRCVRMALVLNHFDTVRDLRESIYAETRIPTSQMILCQLTKEGFGATYSNEQPLSDITDYDNVYAIETQRVGQGAGDATNQFDSQNAQVLVVHVERTESSQHRFASPSLLKVNRDIRWKDLQREMLYKLDDAVCPEIFLQKLSNLFSMQIWDGSSHTGLLPMDVEMPLFTQAAERALDNLGEDFGPSHIKILAIWNPQTKNKVILDDREHFTEHVSIRELMNNPPSQDVVSLDECFRLYTQEEKLIGEDAWMCPHCNQLQQGTVKSLGLWSLPDILILHLKRFKQSGLRRSKLNTLIDFPVDNFDMSPHLTLCNKLTNHNKSDESTYDLIGVCNHFGNMMGGHYTAFCRSPVDGKWREFNDNKVRFMEKSVVNREAYILFYQRRSLSKDINQKLFTGDHWVFSLPLSPEEKELSSAETSPREEEPLPRSHKNRSRSTSPSLRRHSNGPAKRLPLQPSTPQPTRKPAVLSFYTDDADEDRNSAPSSPEKPSARPSRPVHRQTSSIETIKRGKSANAVKSPTRGLYERRNDAEDAAFAPSKIAPNLTYLDSHEVENGTIVKSKTSAVSVMRHSKENSVPSSENGTIVKSKTPAVSVVRHSKENSVPSSPASSLQYRNDIPAQGPQSKAVNNTGSPRQRNLVDSSVGIESDAKYPASVHIPPSHKESETDSRYGVSAFSGHRVRDNFQPASTLQVNLYPVGSHSASSQTSISHAFDSTLPSSSGEARRKLAELMRQSSNEMQNGHTYVTKPTAGTLSKKYQYQSSYEASRRNPAAMDLLPSIDDLALSDVDDRGSDAVGMDIPNDHRTFRYNEYRKPYTPGDRSSYPPRSVDEDYYLYSNGARLDSSLRSRVDEESLASLAQRHFGDPHSGIDSYAFSKDPVNAPSLYQKCATIARSREITPHHHKDILSFPRSSTDQNISYRSDLPHHLVIPESSSFVEPRYTYRSREPSTYSSSRLSEREINAIRSYDTTSRRLRARGVWGVTASQSAKVAPSKVPTPCLRESSV